MSHLDTSSAYTPALVPGVLASRPSCYRVDKQLSVGPQTWPVYSLQRRNVPEINNALEFLWGFIRHPRNVGSIIPSSRYLAAAVADQIPPQARYVAELGPGTGPITRVVLEHLPADGSLLALEIDPAFCAHLRRTLPDPRLRIVRAPAQQLPERANETGCVPIQAVVSGLPFANFPIPMRLEILRAVHQVLPPGGVFAGYGYAPTALPAALRTVFGNCDTSFVFRNIPPAFVFTSRKRA